MFLSHIHNFRAFAIIGIVGAHSLHAFQWNDHPLMFRFFDTFFNQSSILFFFIAGFLFQYLSKRFEKYFYWKKKIQYVILPYVLLSIPGLYYYTQIGIQDNTWEGFYDYSTIKQIFFFMITGKHLAPFWFVPTIVIFYIFAPLLIKADRDRRIYWLLPLFMVISFIIGRGGHYGPINKAAYLFSIYLFGMFSSIHHDKILEIVKKYHVIMLITVAALILGNVFTVDLDQYFIYVSKLLMCPLLMYYLYKSRDFFGDRLNYLGHISFGIFFIHAYVLPIIKLSYLKFSGNIDFPEGNIISYTLVTLSVTVTSMAIIYLCQRIAGKYSRMILGA
ncbi:MAG: acyltransferase [Emcibacter sp.]|nr:acyltransferase [Emcibacter sp.]